MHERAARLPPVGACLGQTLPPAHLGRVPAVVAVPVDIHLLARPRGSRYVRQSCYGIRSVRGDPTACLLVEELLSPGHGARGQRRTGRAEPLSFRDPLERRPQAAPAHASLQGHRSAWHWRLGLGLGLGLVVAAARHMCQPASQESHSSISCALSSRPHLTQWSSASSSELPPLIPASRDLQLLAGEGQNADEAAERKPILPDSRLTRCARDVLN